MHWASGIGVRHTGIIYVRARHCASELAAPGFVPVQTRLCSHRCRCRFPQCAAQNLQVAVLELAGLNLTGPVPAGGPLTSLRALSRLDLSRNNYTGRCVPLASAATREQAMQHRSLIEKMNAESVLIECTLRASCCTPTSLLLRHRARCLTASHHTASPWCALPSARACTQAPSLPPTWPPSPL